MKGENDAEARVGLQIHNGKCYTFIYLKANGRAFLMELGDGDARDLASDLTRAADIALAANIAAAKDAPAETRPPRATAADEPATPPGVNEGPDNSSSVEPSA